MKDIKMLANIFTGLVDPGPDGPDTAMLQPSVVIIFRNDIQICDQPIIHFTF